MTNLTKLLPLNIQLFAKDDDEIDFEGLDDLDKDIEDTEVEETNDETSTDNATDEAQIEDDKATEESKDTSKEDVATDEAKKVEVKEQDFKNEKNRQQAQARREREAQDKAIREGYVKGTREALGNINPFTNEKMVDDVDFEIYEKMKACKDKGYNPMTEMFKYERDLLQEQKSKISEQEKIRAKAKSDLEDFRASYPDVDINKVINNEDFNELFGDVLGDIGIKKAYDQFQKIQGKAKSKLEELAIKKEAKSKSVLGNQTNTNDGDGEYYSKEQLENITKNDDWKKNAKIREKVLKSYDKL